jgi:hypothetical protein
LWDIKAFVKKLLGQIEKGTVQFGLAWPTRMNIGRCVNTYIKFVVRAFTGHGWLQTGNFIFFFFA